MPTSDGTPVFLRFAVISPTGLIRRTGLAEQAMIAMQAVDADDTVIAPLDEPSFGVIIAPVDPELDDRTQFWNFSIDDWDSLPQPPEDPAYWDGSAWVAYPPRPNDFCEWDGSAWVDPRDPGQIIESAILARHATHAEKGHVLYQLALAGGYPLAELSDDSTYFPATVEEYLDSIPAQDRENVRVTLKMEPMIWRMHAYVIGDPGQGIQGFVPWLAAEKSVIITEAQIDAIFGVPLPVPLYEPPEPEPAP